jgi:hypothetical protein
MGMAVDIGDKLDAETEDDGNTDDEGLSGSIIRDMMI